MHTRKPTHRSKIDRNSRSTPGVLVHYDPSVLDFFSFIQFCPFQAKEILCLPWLTTWEGLEGKGEGERCSETEDDIEAIFFPILSR